MALSAYNRLNMQEIESKIINNLESFLGLINDYPETLFYRGQASIDFVSSHPRTVFYISSWSVNFASS